MNPVDISPGKASILVAAEAVADAELIESMLSDDFANLKLSVQPENAVSDFETAQPAVLVLAFDSLDTTMQYCAELYRQSEMAQTRPYRTVVLCTRHEVWRAFELCRKGKFDDYVLFWPVTNDAPRLRMAVLSALDRLKAALPEQVSAHQLATMMRPLANLAPELAQYVSQIEQHADAASLALRQTVQALDGQPPPFDPAAVDRLRKQIQSVANAVGLLGGVAGEARQGLDAHLGALKLMLDFATRVRPVVLMVDDDEFQQKLVARALAGQNIDVVFASCAADVMAQLWHHRPNVVLMDIGLPDVDGIEMTRRIRGIANFSDIQIVMVTGHSERHVVVESLRAGAADFLVKPLHRAKLLEKLQTFIAVSAG